MLEYHFRIEHKLGHANHAVDTLSRVHEEHIIDSTNPSSTSLFMASRLISEILVTLRKENSTLEDLLSLHQQFSAGTLSLAYSVHDGLLFFRQRYYINPQSSLKSALLHEFHTTPLAGHAGVKGTLVCLLSVFFWPNMRRNVEKLVAASLICQQTKYSTQAPTGLLQPLPISSLVSNEVTMDFIRGLLSSRGFTIILVVVDRLTKSAHFGPHP